ncbi:CaiB/BaiF CoA-transferase family protein [Thioclava sp. A2]|uniref:CaiB/BaiF CoA transferase family protein n=1 Tax=Thioclava sp. FCG-A2 TaxID=3080562 RepID=UPI0029553216|nr:CaiB/BaiF CoA-transferase family protein [Thioclava sp. A2]MDV7269306.1 CaiB/BaiF CoA-transferase family protein [Thioclava sp. A2]
MTTPNRGPLTGLRIVEISGLGPTPFTAMLFADMGAEVIRIARPNSGGAGAHVLGIANDILDRGRDVVELDLKSPEGKAAARALIARADALIEGMRPGVMERLGLGPDDFTDHPALVYGRMTGWGQTGPMAQRAGHDINYIALTGALHTMGAESPAIPLNLLGDFGGGGMYLAFGMLAALFHARATGQGQVVDGAITDGVAHLMGMITGMAQQGVWQDKRRANLLDGGAPFYAVYACACGGHMAVGALEPQFYQALLEGLELDPAALPDRENRANWPALHEIFTACFASRSRDDWAAVFAQSDACATPVLTLAEARAHPQNKDRGAYIVHEGVNQPAPAPRLSRTPGRIGAGSALRRITPAEALARWGSAQ